MRILRAVRRSLSALLQDVRFGARVLRRAPLATAVMVGSTAIGIGVTTAVFTLADVMLFRRLPYPMAERLVVLYQTETVRSQARKDTVNWTFAQYEALQQTVRAFDDAGFASWSDAIARPADEERAVRIEAITPSLLSTFSMKAQLGRLLTAEDDTSRNAATVAMISDELWRSTYGGNEAAIGRTIFVNRVPVTIVGIMPAGFRGFAIGADLWLPMRMMARVEPSARWTERLMNQTGTVIARMAAGLTTAQATRQVEAAFPIVIAMAATRFAAPEADRAAGLTTLAESRQHPLVRSMLQVMAVAVGILLLIVCANVASLLLARGHDRQREMGVRVAMGASHARVRFQALTESTLLGLLGLPLGVLLAYVAAGAIGAARPPLPQHWVLLRGTDLLAGASLAPNARVLAFAAAMAALSTLLFGIGPAIVQSRVDAARLVTSGGDSHTSPPIRGRRLLVASQVALATMLLVAAGLLTRSMNALLRTDLGFQAAGVVAVQLTSMDQSASARIRRTAFFEHLALVPGVSGVASAGCVPFDLSCVFSVGVRAAGQIDASARPLEVDLRGVSSEYLRVLRIGIVAGRPLVREDSTAGMGHVVISEAAARHLFGDVTKALGRAVTVDGSTGTPMTVVGVSRDVRFRSVEGLPAPAIYFLHGEDEGAPRFQTTAFIRTNLPDAAAITMITRVLRESGAPMAVADVRSLTALVRAATATTRFVATLLVGFAGAALILAALGIYGIIAYIVAQRHHELGIRLALGADTTLLTREIALGGATLVGSGIVVGLALALAASKVIAVFLYGVTAADPGTTLAVVSLVGAIGGVATLASTLRVRRIDAAQALRA